MASKTSKWMTVVASGAISVMMGGAAFAAPVTAFEGRSTKGLLPDPISKAVKVGRAAASEGPRQVRQVRSTDDASDLISTVLGKVASNVGTKVADAKGQARQVLRPAS